MGSGGWLLLNCRAVPEHRDPFAMHSRRTLKQEVHMQIPSTNAEIIPTNSVPPDPLYNNLRILRTQNDPNASNNFRMRVYQFQDPTALFPVRATLARKGYVSDAKPSHQRI